MLTINPTTITLQVGKAYRTRHGDVATIIFLMCAADRKEFIAVINGDEGQYSETYHADGSYFDNGRESCFDLVEEIR